MNWYFDMCEIFICLFQLVWPYSTCGLVSSVISHKPPHLCYLLIHWQSEESRTYSTYLNQTTSKVNKSHFRQVIAQKHFWVWMGSETISQTLQFEKKEQTVWVWNKVSKQRYWISSLDLLTWAVEAKSEFRHKKTLVSFPICALFIRMHKHSLSFFFLFFFFFLEKYTIWQKNLVCICALIQRRYENIPSNYSP